MSAGDVLGYLVVTLGEDGNPDYGQLFDGIWSAPGLARAERDALTASAAEEGGRERYVVARLIEADHA